MLFILFKWTLLVFSYHKILLVILLLLIGILAKLLILVFCIIIGIIANEFIFCRLTIKNKQNKMAKKWDQVQKEKSPMIATISQSSNLNGERGKQNCNVIDKHQANKGGR